MELVPNIAVNRDGNATVRAALVGHYFPFTIRQMSYRRHVAKGTPFATSLVGTAK